jgi:hypothetical protein
VVVAVVAMATRAITIERLVIPEVLEVVTPSRIKTRLEQQVPRQRMPPLTQVVLNTAIQVAL